MFTVLIIEKTLNERMREDALEVRRSGDEVTVRWSDGIETRFDGKKTKQIFVMNRYGATVGKYRLGP